MSALICDICGGNLAMDASGKFALCESCGMKHTKDRVRAKVQEIQGVVEVTKGEAEKERLLKNAETFWQLSEVERAKGIYEQLTNDYPSDHRGWLGLANVLKLEAYNHILEIGDDLSKVCYRNVTNGQEYRSCIQAKKLLQCFSRLNYYYKKLCKLNEESANSITRIEEAFIEDYNQSELPFLNWLSAMVLTRYDIIIECSDIIKGWAENIVDLYIEKFRQGEVTELYWYVVDPYKEVDLYPAAINFLKEGYAQASNLNQLEMERQQNLLRTLGIDACVDGVCVFWLNTTLAYYQQRNAILDENREVILEKWEGIITYNTQISVNASNISYIMNEKLREIDMKCAEALTLCRGMSNAEPLLKTLLERFANKNLYDGRNDEFYNRFSYHITEIDTFGVSYDIRCYFKGTRDEEWHYDYAYWNKMANFDYILQYVRAYAGKCVYCGGEFRGKTCSRCGRTKNK